VLPTVTDANVVLGYLDAASPLGGDLAVDRGAAEAAIAAHIAGPLGVGVREAAALVIEVVNAAMTEALRIVSIERGLDPAEFNLIAFGGAGPVHACALAGELGIPCVVLPPAPGAFSALGLVASDLRRDYSRTYYSDLGSVDPGHLGGVVAGMEAQGLAMLASAGIAAGERAVGRSADLRYPRQAYELTVPMAGGDVTGEAVAALMAAFHALHLQTYGHANPGAPVQMVNVRVSATGRLPGLRLAQVPKAGGGAARGRAAWFPGVGTVECAVYWRDALVPGTALAGPAIIDALDCTAVVPPGWAGTVDDRGFVHLRRVSA
jgi:N-methylhydantoinase A